LSLRKPHALHKNENLRALATYVLYVIHFPIFKENFKKTTKTYSHLEVLREQAARELKLGSYLTQILNEAFRKHES
jgi:hypothetical protein